MLNKKIQDFLASGPISFIFLQENQDLIEIASSARTKQELVNASIALLVGVVSIMLKDLSKMLVRKIQKKAGNGKNKANV